LHFIKQQSILKGYLENGDKTVVDIFDEIKEDIQQEKWGLLWQKHQRHIYMGLAGIVAFTIVGLLWQYHESSKITAQSDAYMQALMETEVNPESSLVNFERIPGRGESIYASLARFWAAALLLKKGDDTNAEILYGQINKKTSSIFPTSRDTQMINHVAVVRDAAIQVDKGDPQAVLKNLSSLAKEDNPWRFSAWELSGLAKMKLQDKAGALEFFEKIMNDPKALPSFKIRAQAMINYVNNAL
jgi:hypothetical protein